MEADIKQITRYISDGTRHCLDKEIVERYARKLWHSRNFQKHLERYSIQRTVQEVFEVDDLFQFALEVA